MRRLAIGMLTLVAGLTLFGPATHAQDDADAAPAVQRVDVLQVSGYIDPILVDAIDDAWTAGSVVIMAAGNTSSGPLLFATGAALLVTALAFHVDMLLYYLLVPLLPRYARELDLNPMKVGILFGSYAVALLLATFPVAILTDRYGRRAPMLWGLAGLAATTLVFAMSKQYWLLVLAIRGAVKRTGSGAGPCVPVPACSSGHLSRASSISMPGRRPPSCSAPPWWPWMPPAGPSSCLR